MIGFDGEPVRPQAEFLPPDPRGAAGPDDRPPPWTDPGRGPHLQVALVFAFGLLHGLGFAGVLSELGLPRAEFLPALISFNLGFEAGQLAVISLALLAVGLFRRRSWYRRAIVVPASRMIAASASTGRSSGSSSDR